MNWKRRIAKEWLWLLGSIAGGFLLWSVLGFYKPPPIKASHIVTDSKLERHLIREELKIQVQRLIDAGVPEPEIKKFIKKFGKGQETESSLPPSSESVEVVSRSYIIEKWKELRIIFAVLLVPFLYFMRITVWSFKQIRKKPK